MNPLIEIRSKWWTTALLLPFIAFLVIIFYWFILGPGVETLEEPPTGLIKVVAWLVMGVGAFLFYYFFKMTLKPVTLFLADENGFELNMGISTGFITWDRVEKVTLKPIRSTRANIPDVVPVMAVYLKDANAFREQYNPGLKTIMKLNDSMRGTSILIPSGFSKDQYQKFRELVERKVGVMEVETEV